ncbi:unnamed protein product [Closterium sp. Naga37s-1]|nr:unnamed protein product [Closterium sp. Naga37s-1]
MPRNPPKERAPLVPKNAVAAKSADKGKEVMEDNQGDPIPSGSGLTLEEKLAALTSASEEVDEEFTDDDSDDELDFDITKDFIANKRYTAILLLPFVLQQEIASVIVTAQMLLKRVWSSLLSDGANTQVNFQELPPGYVAKTKYSRLQVSFLKEEDATNVRQATLDYQQAKGTSFRLHWLHTENLAFTRLKATNPRCIEAVFRGIPANISPEGLEELLVKYKLKIRQVPPFLEGHCFHRVLHPVSGADTDVIKGLVVPHPEDNKSCISHRISTGETDPARDLV